MKVGGVTVLCSRCGKRLRATEMLARGSLHVRRHKNPDGKPCMGWLLTNHKPESS